MLEEIERAARMAGKLILEARKPEAFKKEGHYNFVTQTDLQVQEFLYRELSAIFAEAVFYAEEKANEPLTKAYTWVVDPIDGTLNYMHHRDCSAISVALLKDRVPVLGLIYNPFRDEVFTAEKGQGAFLNGQAIHVSDYAFENAMVSMGTAPYEPKLLPVTMKAAAAFLARAGDLRRCGSAALDLCDVACGRCELFFEYQLAPWDIAAGSLIVEEAGGSFAEFLEPAVTYDKKVAILASNQTCLEKALKILRECQ